MNDALKKRLEGTPVGASVTAAGVDTRGHAVTRTGTLLASPKAVTATRNGARAKGVRLCVGDAGTDPAQRSTWVTLFPDSGTVELVEEKRAEWTNGPLGQIPGIRATALDGLRFHFGGKGGKRSTEPAEPVTLVGVSRTGEGKYEVVDVDNGAVLLTCTLQTQVWWLPVGGARQELGVAEAASRDDIEHQEQGQGDGKRALARKMQDIEDEYEAERSALRAKHARRDQGQARRLVEHEYGKAVYHVRTRHIVGYLNEKRGVFTPIADVPGGTQP